MSKHNITDTYSLFSCFEPRLLPRRLLPCCLSWIRQVDRSVQCIVKGLSCQLTSQHLFKRRTWAAGHFSQVGALVQQPINVFRVHSRELGDQLFDLRVVLLHIVLVDDVHPQRGCFWGIRFLSPLLKLFYQLGSSMGTGCKTAQLVGILLHFKTSLPWAPENPQFRKM